MPKPSYRRLNAQAVRDGALRSLLPEVYALEQVRERSDWHSDDAFEQSLRLLQWIDELPPGLPAQAGADQRALSEALATPIDAAHEDHTLHDALRFAALIHDVGKRATFEIKDDGNTSCPDHEVVGARLAPRLCARFDCTAAEGQLIAGLVKAHGEPYALFKQITTLPAPEQDERAQRFALEHMGHLLPLLLLAYGDLVTSQLEAHHPQKYATLVAFYHHWLRDALHRRGGQ